MYGAGDALRKLPPPETLFDAPADAPGIIAGIVTARPALGGACTAGGGEISLPPLTAAALAVRTDSSGGRLLP